MTDQKNKWALVRELENKDHEIALRAAKNHSITVKTEPAHGCREDENFLLFMDKEKALKIPRNEIILFELTINAFDMCRRMRDVLDEYMRYPDALDAQMAILTRQTIASVEKISLSNDEVMKRAIKSVNSMLPGWQLSHDPRSA
jgi:hypothetical protein